MNLCAFFQLTKTSKCDDQVPKDAIRPDHQRGNPFGRVSGLKRIEFIYEDLNYIWYEAEEVKYWLKRKLPMGEMCAQNINTILLGFNISVLNISWFWKGINKWVVKKTQKLL